MKVRHTYLMLYTLEQRTAHFIICLQLSYHLCTALIALLCIRPLLVWLLHVFFCIIFQSDLLIDCTVLICIYDIYDILGLWTNAGTSDLQRVGYPELCCHRSG
jgi:hypothetical protein